MLQKYKDFELCKVFFDFFYLCKKITKKNTYEKILLRSIMRHNDDRLLFP